MACEDLCNDYGDPLATDCERVADPAYRMDFRDIGEGFIHWCKPCGLKARAMETALVEAMNEDPSFADKFGEAIGQAVVEFAAEKH